ncbi:autotransporter outer membrane beta-barrel domain-containing protein [Sphingorhabdus sp. Alg231-15]|uniref:autotransporter outer membrane beta-barrel domain-containing protein n=1 Tax=Sphingorhabdus sp. Alg231-15 TaxID=1922222 RepID=UPI000D5585F4
MPRFDLISDISPIRLLNRGGRLVEWKGGTASIVPQTGQLRLTVSAAAVGTALLFGTGMLGTAPAMAGTCTETAPGSGVFVCSGPADAAADTTQILGGTPVTVTTEAGFGITTAVDNALTINGVDGASFDDAEAAAITGQQNGISIDNEVGGSLSLVSNGIVTGISGNGISAQNETDTLNLSITSNVAIGANDGIYATQEGDGGITVTSTGMAVGEFYDGIDAYNAGTYLTVNAVETMGGENGILAINEGTLALTVTSTGTADGDTADGIFARNFGSASDLTVNSNIATGGEYGIQALNEGRGALTINTTGTTTGTTEVGILALNSTNSTSLSITAADVIGGTYGIVATNDGSAGLTISTTGDITGQGDDGIYAYNSVNDLSGMLQINQDAGTTITGAVAGIDAINLSGAMTISALGTVEGQAGDGINAFNRPGTTDLTITSDVADGANMGIRAYNGGTGVLTVTSTGMANGDAFDGINAQNEPVGGDMIISAVDTSGGQNGISAYNEGVGALTITSTGTATGTNFYGIEAINSSNSTDLTINAADSLGGINGINADNDGTGALTINSTGTAEGEAVSGIFATNGLGATDLTITSNVATGNLIGVAALNLGTGALTITTTGTTTGEVGSGTSAFNSVYGTALTVNAADTSGGENGIQALNGGQGALTVNSTGAAIGAGSDGIYARNSPNGTDLAVTAADTDGADHGIYALNEGNGALTIDSTGTAIGTSVDGIYSQNTATGTDMTITSNVATGANNGIFADHNGQGALTVTSSGAASGGLLNGITAQNSFDGTDLTVISNVATGASNGIFAYNDGEGALTVTSTGATTGTASDGIFAFNTANGTSLSITAADVTGGQIGVRAENFGSAGLTVSVTGDVTGQGAAGIFAYNSANDVSASMEIDQETGTTTTGATDGIDADNFGGSLTIIALGTAIGQAGNGINAINNAGTTDLTITSNVATGSDNGIFADNDGDGALAINSTGSASGDAGDGIEAYNSTNGTSLTVNAVNTDGGVNGLFARNRGDGALSITSTGTANGHSDEGIDAYNSAFGTSLTIAAADTAGQANGIFARNFGTGALDISATGSVSGTEADGIDAVNSAAGTSLSVTAADVSGGVDGINVLQEGTEAASVTTSGTVAGGTGNAITAVTTGSSIAVNNSGTLESGAGFALEAIGGVTQLTNSGTVNGRVQLSAFDDITLNTGLFNATLDSDFGTGTDLFTNEGTVSVGGIIAFTGLEQFVNNGLIEMRNDMVGNSLTIWGDYAGSGDGSFGLDVSFDGTGSADVLVVAGTATGNTTFAINDISTSPNFGNRVLVVDAGAGTNEDAFALDEPGATIGFFAYSVFYEAPDNDFYLTNTIGTPVFQTLKFVEGAQSLWYRSADAWAAHMATPTDSSASPAWMQIYGTVTNQDDSFEFGEGGLTEPVAVNYEQDYFGLQAGYEFGSGVTGDGGLFGLTAGYLNSNLGFDGTADNVRYDAFNIGVYAGLKSDRFFANALAKYDFIAADVRARSAGYTADLDGSAYGVRLEAGYRFGDEKFFVQPLTSFEYQRASLDDFSALGAEIAFDEFDGVRAMAGARLGGEATIWGGNNMTYYLGGQAVQQKQTGDGLAFTSGDSSIEIDNRLSRTFGRLELGLSIATQGGVTGFIEGNADVSGDYTGIGGRGGLKVQF